MSLRKEWIDSRNGQVEASDHPALSLVVCPDPEDPKATEPKSAPQRWEYIDALRGLAILLVMFFHSSQRVPGMSWNFEHMVDYGQLGVQCFFVVSGLTLCLSWASRGSEPYAARNFYIRRFLRIAPMYCVGILAYAIFKLAMHQEVPLAPLLCNVFLIHGLVPAANNTVVPGGWSIGTEALFYLLFPMVIGLVLRYKLKTAHVIGIFLASTALAFSQQLVLGKILVNGFWYFFLLTQAPAFLCGFVVFLESKKERGFFTHSLAPSLIALICLIAAVRLRQYVFLPAFAGAFFACIALRGRSVRSFPPLLTEIGRRSYSMYILHFLAAWFLFPTLLLRFDLPRLLGAPVCVFLNFFAVLALTYPVSRFTLEWIEKPGQNLAKRWISRLAAG